MSHNPLTVDEIINLDDSEDLDNEKLPPIDETQNLTEHNLITSPWSRIGIIGLPLGIGFLVFYFLFNNIINGKPTANNPHQNEQKSTQATQSNNSDGDIYAQLALAKQQEQLQKLNQNKEKTPAPVQNSSGEELKPVANQTQPIQVSSAPPPPRTYSSPARTNSSSSTTYSPPPRAYSPPRTYSPPQRNLAASTPPLDPMAEIERLRSIGSYGQVAYVGSTTANAPITNLDSDTQTNLNTEKPLSQTDEPPLPTTEETATETGIEKIRPRWTSSVKSNVRAKNYLSEENQIIQGRKAQYLLVGQMASGVLVTPLIKEQSDSRNQSRNATTDDGRRYVARLTADLKDNHGQIAIPNGSLLAVELVSVDGAKGAIAQVRSIILNNTEYQIKPGAITVLGDNSQPLIARKFHDRGGEIARGDLTVGVVSALGKVGEVINQPDSEEEIEDEFTGRIRRRSSGNRRNLTGALLEGAFGSLSSILGERARSSTEEIQSRPNIWYIPKDTRVTFLVNRTLEMEMP